MIQSARNASPTIKGYNYQFDATILKFIQIGDEAELLIEGIEDFDVKDGDVTCLHQCKYLSSKAFTPSSARDAILPMLQNYKDRKMQGLGKLNYRLYGFFKDSEPGAVTITIEFLKKVLTKKEKKNDGNKDGIFKTIVLQDKLGLTDGDLIDFLDHFQVHISKEFDSHKNEVISSLASHLGRTELEVEKYHYPNAYCIVSDIAGKVSDEERKLTKLEFMNRVSDERVVFNVWMNRMMKERDYEKQIRKLHFSERNIEPIDRVFILDNPKQCNTQTLKSLLLKIREKWSSHEKIRTPNNERYAPYVFFRNLSSDKLSDLKTELLREQYRFVDGYCFQGAEFNFDELQKKQTRANQISLRFVNSQEILMLCANDKNKTKVFYDFFRTKPFEEEICHKFVSIHIKSLEQIIHII